MNDKQVLMTYSVLNNLYSNGSIRYVRGLQDAASGTPDVGTIDTPSDTGLPLRPTVADPKVFSYGYKGEARFLIAKVTTSAGTIPSTDTWTLVAVPDPAYGGWNTLAKDITLHYSVDVATNPYGVAQIGDWLYIVDYDSQKIIRLGVNELNGFTDGSTISLKEAPYDLSVASQGGLSSDAKGQAIIALSDGGTNYLYALYTVSSDPSDHQDPGILVRLTVDASGAPAYDTKTQVGPNPQEIIPVTPSGSGTQLLIPAIGGIQNPGATNGILSNIISVPAFAASPWPAAATVLVTGNASTGPTPAYDFHSIAAALRPDDNGFVYILTIDYAAGYKGTDWALYRTTVSHLLGLAAIVAPTIAQAGFTLVDSGNEPSGYFWSILFENGEIAANDRLWFFRGTPLLVTPALVYTAPPQTSVANKFFDFGNAKGQIGGDNVDWADLTIETLRQAAAGVSLKRGFRSVIKAPKALEEEEKGKK
jgi:hypothetical protein